MPEQTFSEILEETIEQCRVMDAPLSVRLKGVADVVRGLSPEFSEIVDRMVARLASNGVGLAAPKPGEPMPEFLLPDENGHLVSLAGLLAQGPVVISFNRGHWCPYCRINVDALARIAPEVKESGAQIIAISPETGRYGSELKAYAKAPFPILSDIDGSYALELGLLFWVGDEKRSAMQAGGLDLSTYQGSQSWMLPIPATFVVGADGIVLARSVDPDYRHRMELDDLLAALRAGPASHAD